MYPALAGGFFATSTTWEAHNMGTRYIFIITRVFGFPGGSDIKESACNAGDPSSLGWEDSPGEENGNPLQYSCLENPMDRGAWWAR